MSKMRISNSADLDCLEKAVSKYLAGRDRATALEVYRDGLGIDRSGLAGYERLFVVLQRLGWTRGERTSRGRWWTRGEPAQQTPDDDDAEALARP